MSIVSVFAERLSDSQSDLKAKLSAAVDLRDSVELHQVSSDPDAVVNTLVPAILSLLESVPVSMHVQTVEHRLRHTLLDVLSRLQTNSALQRATGEILRVVMQVLRTDNEENGFICMRIFTNLHRAYKQQLQDSVKPFFEFVVQVFKNMRQLVEDQFNSGAVSSSPGFSASPEGSAGGAAVGDQQVQPAIASFKVLTECPIIIVLLYSNHKQLVPETLPVFLPLIIEMLSMEAAPQAKEHAAATSRGEMFTGVSANIHNKQAYHDFITAQIKIMSFLAYALRAFSTFLQPYYNLVPNFVVRLLKDCPPELSGARKELLVSMRHILSTDFRTYFISKVDVLLEERVLIGVGLTAQETLWPLAYSTMADLIHHVRNELSVSQIWKAVRVYCRNLQNNQLATSFQIMSAKLLLNFMERVLLLPDHQEGRNMMVVILRSFVDRFTDLNRTYRDLVQGSDGLDLSMTQVLAQPIIQIHGEPASGQEIKDAKYVFKNLMAFLKTVMFGFKKCNPAPPPNIPPQQWDESARGFSYNDVNLFRQLFRQVINGMLFFATPSQPIPEKHDFSHSLPIITSKDEKELMEVFATVFIHVDAATFNEIIGSELEFFFQATFRNKAILHITQLFLGNETTSANFSGLLLRFLLKKLPELGEGDLEKTNILLQLFKLCFMAVNLFPQTNEQVILPHFKDLIIESLKLTSTAQHPIVYSHLLRALFRSIGGGRFEALYKAVLPLLQTLLETLNKRMQASRIPAERDVYVELCLTVPVRLSLLVPHLNHLMRPLVIALNGGQELVSQGLRTLELCVDNLTASYFDPIIEPVLDDVMKALWKHLRPLPYHHQHSHTTLRILGKLGGRNRAFLKPPQDLQSLASGNQDVSAIIQFKGLGEDIPLNITPGIEQAFETLQNMNVQPHYKRMAFDFLAVAIKQFIPRDNVQDLSEFSQVVRRCVRTSLSTTQFDGLKPLPDGSHMDLQKRDKTNELCERILEAIFFAASIPELKDDATKLALELCEHCALLELGEFTIEKRRAMRAFSLEDHEGTPYLMPRVIVSAIFYALCHYNSDVRELGLEGIRVIFQSGRALCGQDVESYRYPLIRALFSKLSHGCFEEQFYRKAGACRTLRFMFTDIKFSLVWIRARHLELIRTILFVIKDVSPDSPSEARDDAAELLYHLIQVCNKDLTPEQTKERPFTLLSGLLAFELESANKNVRETAKHALQLLAETTGQSLTDILSSVTNVFLNPIFVKPLRALPFPMQVGYIDAISFCVQLPHTFLDFGDEKLTRLLEEVLALVEAEDESLTSAHRLMEYTTSQQLIELRVVCIKLLSLALTTAPDHFTQHKPQMKAKIIAVLLKTLSSNKIQVVDAAHAALKEVLAFNPRPPRDILQNGLRPTLVTLSDYSRLTVSGLDSLSRLLVLFSNYFKVELGRKLLEHLKDWAKPLAQHANKILIGNEHIEKGVAILNVFHSLPAAAHVFINDVVQVLLYVETNLRRVHSSPFRQPVAKYLERYPAESFQYFSGHFSNFRFGRLFSDLLQMPICKELRKYTREHIDEIRQQVQDMERPEDKCMGICNLIYTVKSLSVEEAAGGDAGDGSSVGAGEEALDASALALVDVPESENAGDAWLLTQQPLLQFFGQSVEEMNNIVAELPTTSPLVIDVRSAVEALELVAVKYTVLTIQQGHKDPILFDLVANITPQNTYLYWTLADFIFENVVCSTDTELRRFYLEKSLPYVLSDKPCSTFVMKYIVNAILVVEVNRHDDLSQLLSKIGSGGWIDKVHQGIWQATSGVNNGSTIDRYQLALLEMSVLIVKTSSALIADARKDVIKFGWSFIKYEDIMSKISAYVLVTYFIASYDTLAKIVVQIYVALLKTHQLEAKPLVTQALDVLAPVLVKRINSPLWAKWPRRILAEDGHNVAHVANIYDFIARHPKLFYEYRDHFVPFIVAAMAKVSSIQNVSIDVDLAELLATWEQMASEDQGENVYRVSTQQRDIVMTYLVRFIVALPQTATENANSQRVLKVIDLLLGKLWTDVQVHLDFFDRSLMQGDLITPAAIVSGLNALAVVKITLEHKPKEWFSANLDRLQALLERSLRCSTSQVHEALGGVLHVIFQKSDLELEETQSFLRTVVSAIQEHWSATTPVNGWIYLAKEAVIAKPSCLDQIMQGAIKALSRGAKELFDLKNPPPASLANPTAGAGAGAGAGTGGASGAPTPGPAGAPGVPGAPGAAGSNVAVSAPAAGAPNGAAAGAPVTPPAPMPIAMLIDILDLIASRISYLGDQRRAFLHVVAQLCSLDNEDLNLHIIAMVRSWVFSRTELFPTVKEKAGLLLKMLVDFENTKKVDLLVEYYKIIIGIFEDEQLAKTELPARLEQPFLVGCTLYRKQQELEIRTKLLGILCQSLEKNALDRLQYVLMEQNWELLADRYWLNEGLQLIFDTVDDDKPVELDQSEFKLAPFQILEACFPENEPAMDEEPSEPSTELDAFLARRKKFVDGLKTTGSQLINPLRELQYQSNNLVHDNWLSVFPKLYKQIPGKERNDIVQSLVVFLSKDYHTRQADHRPNVIATILEAVAKVEFLPPELVKYLCGNYDAWYSGIEILEKLQEAPAADNSQRVSNANLDALTEIYAGLQENDMFYGLWRKRSQFVVTNSALSYEQCGMWNRAMQMHENAQIKARSGALPYGESEYGLWEDHWILCAEKLQHWDVLTELAKHEGFNDLLLECGWRVADWTSDKEPLEQSIKSLMDAPTPRRQVFESFLCLQGFGQKTETLQSLSKCCDEGIQLVLRKWHGLPKRITAAHIPLLHTFQQYVEFMEASQVYTSLASTTAMNLEPKSQELKGVLQAWHERLPNLWDDINIWSDLVTWRQHVFGVINKVYLPLIPQVQHNNNSSSNNTAAYRGYHEIAWIINRFAHVARKHNMTDVCINLLSKIYTLPNIEVQEAFLKLREQAKCHYQNPNDVSTGLEVISNTNFAFFHAQQKSEFFTLRGMSLAKLGADERANEQFATAVSIDVYLPKAWAEWGKFNDRKFSESPSHTGSGATALSCYLQAAGLYKSAKSRKFLGRILWLMSLDDSTGAIATAFNDFRGELPVWYWVTYVPQLLSSLANKEAPLTRQILIKIAKSFPQALHFNLRTVREDYLHLQRQNAQMGNRNAAVGRAVNSGGTGEESAPEESKTPLQNVEEIMSTLKTSYPLLTLSLETLVDQVYHRFKPPADEDAYRLIVALLNDGVQYMGRLPCPREDTKLPAATEASISRFAEGVLPKHIKASFEADFVIDKPNLETYVLKLRRWRDRFEAKLDARPNKINLEALSPPLNEFHYQKFEEVEVPGQNAELKDSNLHFVKIGRFLSNVDVVRGFGICYRRLTIRGHDGSIHPFAVQYPAARHCRREERVLQLFKILNSVLQRRKEARTRNLQFTLPSVVPMTPHIRLIQDNSNYVSMYHIYEQYCQSKGQSRDAPFDLVTQAMRSAFDPKLPKPDIATVKMEILNRIQNELVPGTIMKDYFTSHYQSFEDFWLFRKQFAYQYAGVTFMTFIMSINNRYPHKFLIDMSNGNVCASEMLPILPATRNTPTYLNGDPVPFRLTPNIQTLMGPTAMEGLYAMAVMIIAKSLTDPEFDLAYFLPIFVRDELIGWYSQQQKPTVTDQQLRDIVRGNVETIVKRAMSLAQVGQGFIPANQTVIDLISMAVNPRNLALTDVLWMPYY